MTLSFGVGRGRGVQSVEKSIPKLIDRDWKVGEEVNQGQLASEVFWFLRHYIFDEFELFEDSGLDLTMSKFRSSKYFSGTERKSGARQAK